MQLRLTVQRVSRARGLPGIASITDWARAALAGSGAGTAEVTVRLVDQAESADLNNRYRRKRGATNVLSFTYGLAPGKTGLAGDLVICAPVVLREAVQQDKRPRAHWAHMLVHGILHLRGFDHVHETDAQIMEALEIRVLKRLGFPDPYA
ncbi:MAG: rRNA maturation RNase YbeY [Pseudomonadota bacterium]